MEAILASNRATTNTLSHLHSYVNEKSDTGLRANNRLQKIKKLEFVITWHFWTEVPCRFYKVSKAIQKSELLLTTFAKLYSSLRTFK